MLLDERLYPDGSADMPADPVRAIGSLLGYILRAAVPQGGG